MGQRGAGAAFMPSKFVFPGGAVDPCDLALPAAPPPPRGEIERLAVDAPEPVARALPLTAVRELWEETGLRLGRADPDAPARAAAAPDAWRGFLAAGLAPRVDALRFVFRAVTPPGRPRRFDARFFLAEAETLADDTERLSGDAELGALQWIGLAEARSQPRPIITGVVLAEIEALLAAPGRPRAVPYFSHDAAGSHFRLL